MKMRAPSFSSRSVLAEARASGAFSPTHQGFWDAARHKLGDGAGTRALIGVMLLHRSLPAQAVTIYVTFAGGDTPLMPRASGFPVAVVSA